MGKTLEVITDNSQLQVSTLIQECLDWSGMKAAQFSQECGFADATRIYGALNQNRDLGVTSFNSILMRFPLLNGDRFIRKSGPLLLSDLCHKLTEVKVETSQIFETVPSLNLGINLDEHYNVIIQGKDDVIMRQEKEIEFLRELIRK